MTKLPLIDLIVDNDISFIPYEKHSLSSSQNIDDIRNDLTNKLEKTDTLGLTFNRNSPKDYEGWIHNNEFRFRRILKSEQNSFISIVSGTLRQEGSKVKIEA